MPGSKSSRAQTYSFDTVPSQERRRSISLSTQEVGWAGIPLVVSLLPFVPFFPFSFLFFSFFPFFPSFLPPSPSFFYSLWRFGVLLVFCVVFILFTAITLCRLFANLIVQPLYIGAAATKVGDKIVRIGISIHDGVYSVDACINQVATSDDDDMQGLIRTATIKAIKDYSVQHQAKFVGAGVTSGLEEICPGICACIWRELDVVAMILTVQTTAAFEDARIIPVDVDEQADSAARKCVMHFGPNHNPVLAIAFRNQVMPDSQGAIKLVEGLREYESTVHKGTWNTVLKYAYELKGYKDGETEGEPQCPPTKIAFFSATPQGGGVALMRHALVRFCGELGVKLAWFVFISSIMFNTYSLIHKAGIFLSLIRRLLESQRQITTFFKE